MIKIKSSAGEGTKENPWKLKTPPGSSEYIMYNVPPLMDAWRLAEIGHNPRNNRRKAL